MEVGFKRNREVVALGANITKPKLYRLTGEDTHTTVLSSTSNVGVI